MFKSIVPDGQMDEYFLLQMPHMKKMHACLLQ
jgi:hypothetical protein